MSITKTYDNFLYDPQKYQQLKGEWENLFKRLFPGEQYYEWVGNKTSDGKEIFDGNPIFSAYFPNKKKAIRIVQINVVEDEPSLTVWEDKAEIKNEVTPELVIFLKTEKIAFLESEKLIKLFLDEKLFTSTIELINSQFEELYEKEKSKNPYSQIHFDIPFDTPSSISLESKIPLLHSQMLKYGTTATLHHCDYFSANSYFRHALSHWHALRQASNIYVLDAAVNTSYFPDQKILIFLSANHPIAQNDLQHLLKNLQGELNSTKK